MSIKCQRIIYKLAKLNVFNFLSDERYLKMCHFLFLSKKLDLEKPVGFNDKIQWLKLNDRKEEYTKLVDKVTVRQYISKYFGEKYLIPIYGIYENFDDINFNELPQQFVLKCNHDSGGVIICKDKSRFDILKAKKKINKILKRNYYLIGREYPYKNVKPKILIEKYMTNSENKELMDYKLFCFNGKVKMILVCSNRSVNLNKTFFDTDWNFIDLIEGNHPNDKLIKKPKHLSEMIEMAEKIAINKKFVRVDFYEIDEKMYFGEITFYPNSGYEVFEPKDYELKLGELIEL